MANTALTLKQETKDQLARVAEALDMSRTELTERALTRLAAELDGADRVEVRDWLIGRRSPYTAPLRGYPHEAVPGG
jgi:predicted transcriptional regulator